MNTKAATRPRKPTASLLRKMLVGSGDDAAARITAAWDASDVTIEMRAASPFSPVPLITTVLVPRSMIAAELTAPRHMAAPAALRRRNAARSATAGASTNAWWSSHCTGGSFRGTCLSRHERCARDPLNGRVADSEVQQSHDHPVDSRVGHERAVVPGAERMSHNDIRNHSDRKTDYRVDADPERTADGVSLKPFAQPRAGPALPPR